MAFKHLFSPLQVGTLTIRNRILFPAHMTLFSQNGVPSERSRNYYAERAKGGVGLIVTEICAVHPTTVKYPQCIKGYDERCIPGFADLAAAVHRHGALVLAQLAHSGARMLSDDSLLPLWAPWTVMTPAGHEVPHAMDEADMADLLDGYARSARNIRQAGLDGVELHAAHEYLLGEFLSSLHNRRIDRYGGTLDNRMCFVREVVECVRGEIGRDRILGIRINGDDFVEGGITLSESRAIAAKLQATGLIDYISVSAFTSHHVEMAAPGMQAPLGVNVPLAAAVREVVEIPVVTVGRINDPTQAERILAEGQADLIGMVRAQICDPEWANKARLGQVDDIRKCIACNDGCNGRLFKIRAISCTQNPAVGQEGELGAGSLPQAQPKKMIVVVGGGPAGMEAARVAALRGHNVVLYERDDQLGGQVNIAAKGPCRGEFGEIARFLSRQLGKLAVQVRMRQEATLDVVRADKPDAVIVATGSTALGSTLAGAEQPNVVNYRQVLLGVVAIGRKVVLIDEVGHFQAYSAAELLAERGHQVEIVTPGLHAGACLEVFNLIPVYRRLLANGVLITTLTKVRAIEENRVFAYNVYTGVEKTIDNVDTVVLAIGNKADNTLFYELKEAGFNAHAVGDCLAPRNALRAIRDGHMIARAL